MRLSPHGTLGMSPVKRMSEFDGYVGHREASGSASVGMMEACPCLALGELSRVMQRVPGAASSPARAWRQGLGSLVSLAWLIALMG